MKTFTIIGKFNPKDSTIAGKGLPILECNELQELILTKIRKSGKTKDYPVRSLICRATLNTELFQGRFILVDRKFRRLSKKEQTTLILQENKLENLEPVCSTDDDDRLVRVTSESDKHLVRADIMATAGIGPRVATKAFMKAESTQLKSAKKAVLKSGEYKAAKKAGETAAFKLDSMSGESWENYEEELADILANTAEDDLEEIADAIFEEMNPSPSDEEAATAAASTPTESEPVPTVVETTATEKPNPVKAETTTKSTKAKKQNAPKGTPAPAV